ncbi:MAG: hypothetical protein M5U08_20985 [Burkholderiales bacterium]|nr:hypothetical protein [Burkholderiales bacterium]
MNVRENALGVLIVALGTSAPVLAQGEPAAALGAGLSLRAAKQPSPDGTHVPAPLIPSPREWWSLAGAQRSLDFGIGLMPRLGLRHAGHTFRPMRLWTSARACGGDRRPGP